MMWRFEAVRYRQLICGLVIATAAATAGAADWPNWRGPDHNGVSAESDWLDRWPAAGPAVAWRAKVGTGFSSFCVAAGRVYTAGNADNVETLFCFDAASGGQLWKYSYPAELGDKYFEGGPSATPAVRDGRLYFNSRWGDVFCLDAVSGKAIWAINVAKETRCRTPEWGFGGSPLLFKNLVVLNMGDAGTALDQATGQVVWKSGKKEAGYSTPLPVEFNGRWLALLGNGTSYLAVELESGKELWQVRWLTQGGINVADPVVEGAHVLISSSYEKGSELLRMGEGEPKVVWKNRELGTHISPGVLVGGYFYGDGGQASQNGPLTCIDWQTGEKKWEYPAVGCGGLIVAGSNLIVLTERGDLLIGPVSPNGFNPTARAHILGGRTWAPPVLSNGRIYLRNAAGEVVCLDVRQK
jgi:outer membrane protein assembly factor BamB